MTTETKTWTTGFGTWHASAPSAQEAARAIRAELLARGAIGKYTPVTVEPVDWQENTYREVWEEPEDLDECAANDLSWSPSAEEGNVPNYSNTRFF